MTGDLILSFITLSLLEIVLGIDNLIFIALAAEKLPMHYRNKARIIGLTLALGIRVLMLAGMSWIIHLTHPLFTLAEHEVSARDLLLLCGGLFLVGKAGMEIKTDVAGAHKEKAVKAKSTLLAAIVQITVIDFIFSFDSIITAVGIATDLRVMVAAVVVAMGVMLVASNVIAGLLYSYPTFKMLALAFIFMIGAVLMAEGLHIHVPKEYIYFAFAFSIFVETLNTLMRRK